MDFRECCFKNIPINGKKLVWEITHSCENNCDYCFQEKKRKNNPQRVLSSNDLLKICDLLPKFEITDVLLTGGELFMVKDILDTVCEKLIEIKVSISFSTAVHRIDFISKLLSYHPKAINLSFDPPANLEIFDRDKQVFYDILNLCGLHNVDVKATGVLTNQNVIFLNDYLTEIKSMSEKYTSLKSIYLTNPYEIGYSTLGLELDKNEQKKIYKKIKLLLEGNDKIKLINFTGLNVKLQKCPAASFILHLEPNGDMYPCHLLAILHKDYYFMGNILNDRCEDISYNILKFSEQKDDAIKEYKAITPECNNCKQVNKCQGGCIAEIVSKGRLIEPKLVCKHINFSSKNEKKIIERVLEFSNSGEDLTKDEYENISKYVFKHIRKGQHDLAHGIDHTKCVVNLARYIAKKEKANLRIVTVAAFFHDYSPRRKLLFEGHTKVSSDEAGKYLLSINFPSNEIIEICKCIDVSSYGADELGFIPLTNEAKIVRDADWLDAIGARGIARVFAFAASNNCDTLGTVDYDIYNPPKLKMSLVGPDPSPIYHFFSKLLWVQDKLQTDTAKEMGIERHRLMIDFLENYKKEFEFEKENYFA